MSKVEAKGVDGPITVEADRLVYAGSLGATITDIDGWSFSVGSTALMDVMRERTRQINEEGWTPDHDDQHDGGELAGAAASYALNAACLLSPYDGTAIEGIPYSWPSTWGEEWWKPSSANPRRDLVKAAALILAEIERLDRADLRKTQEAGQ